MGPHRSAPATPPPGASTAPSDAVSGLLLLALALSYPLVQLARTTLDRVTTVQDVTGAVHFVSEGQAGQLLLLALSLAAALLASHRVLSTWRQGGFALSIWALLALVILVVQILRPGRDPVAVIYAGLTLLVLLGAPLVRLTQPWLARVGGMVPVVAASVLIHAAAVPDRGWALCRPDKCSPAGGLLVGYFPQENVVGMFLATLLPATAFIRRPWSRRLSVLLVLVAVVLTGSRTATAATLLALWSYAVLRRRADPDRRLGDVAKVAGIVPLAALLASTVMVVSLSDMSLTGRGLIFRIVREAWREAPLLGPGRSVLEDAYYASTVNWYLSHEHGQAPYLLAQAGLVGLLLCGLALTVLAVACWVSRGPMPVAFALVPALGFLTEPTWEISLRSPYVTTLVLTVALTATALRRSPLPAPAPAGTVPPARRADPASRSPEDEPRARLRSDLRTPPGR